MTRRRAPIIIGGLILIISVALGAAFVGYKLGQSRPLEFAAQSSDTTSLPSPTQQQTEIPPSPTLEAPKATSTATSTPPATATPTSTREMVTPADLPAAIETALPTLEVEEPERSVQNEPPSGIDLDTFYEVWGLVESEFDGELPENQELLYGAISGSLDALGDDYTRFIRPEIARRLREDFNGSVSGIGAIVRPTDDGFVEIVRPLDNQPADLAGLLAGDIIIAVDGEPIVDVNFDEVILMVRGPAGSKVDLTVVRDGELEPLEFSLIRATFEVPLVESEMIDAEGKQIAYVKLNSFTSSATQEVSAALEGLLEENPTAIIFDLRDNGGGFLDQSVGVADLFLPEGIVLFEKSRNEELDETFRSDSGDLAESLPLVVLVNAGTASASEIVAGAIQDNERGTLIGETTFGKGSVQHVHTLADGSELRITIARWYTPDNRSISEEGIQPDIEVETPVDLGGDSDTQLQRAIDYLLNGE